MWSKLSSALASKANPKQEDRLEPPASTPRVTEGIYQAHPNLSNFRTSEDGGRESPRPSSPMTRLNPFNKRSSKMLLQDDEEGSPLRLPSGIPKRVKSHLSLTLNASTSSLSRSSHDSEARRRPSMDSLRGPKSAGPDMQFSSMRSGILREPKTPGTGSNVRFFSRDVYKAMSPDGPSADSVEPEDDCLAHRLERVSSPRPTAAEIFSNRLDPIHIDTSNLFYMSSNDIPPISPGPLNMFDVPVELEAEDERPVLQATSTPHHRQEAALIEETIFNSAQKSHDRSQSFSFGQTVFFSMARSNSTDSSAASTGSTKAPKARRRHRALSDGMFYRPTVVEATPDNRPMSPEHDINDESSSSLQLYATPPPDPFRVDATTYYTPETLIPPSPPRGPFGVSLHVRGASREEDMMLSLRAQLALQQEMNSQYEVDLAAKDQMARELRQKLDDAELDGHKWRGALKSCKKKVSELQRTCRHLEEEVDGSRQQSFERSVMDEASSEALRHLHRQIGRLEREKDDVKKNAQSELLQMEETVKEKSDALKKVEDTLRRREDSERALRAGIREAREQMQEMQLLDGGDTSIELVLRQEQALDEERERHQEIEDLGNEERVAASQRNDTLEQEVQQLRSQLDNLQNALVQRDSEYSILKTELEAQWATTEANSGTIEALGRDRSSLVAERQTLHMEIQSLEVRLLEVEDAKTAHEAELEERILDLEAEVRELDEAREALEQDRDEADEQLVVEQGQTDELARSLQKRDDRVVALETDVETLTLRISILEQERQFALDNVARLEENIRQREAEIGDQASRSIVHNSEAEELKEELGRVTRDHNRIVDQHDRVLQYALTSERDARNELEALVRTKAATDVEAGLLQVRVVTLTAELENLRRQIHVLQQASADKDLRLVQAQKKATQDQEDLDGLNIALDSKQQELELLKRKSGVRGTAGSAPAQPSKGSHHRHASSVFSTPGPSRPSSVLSDTFRESKGTETPIAASKTLTKSVRGNVPPSVTKPARGIEGAMGPPPKRSSIAGTPSRIPSAPFVRAPSVAGKPIAPMRRVSATSSVASDALKNRTLIAARPSPPNEKENLSRSRLRKVPAPPV